MSKLLRAGRNACHKRNYFDEQGFKREKSKSSGYYQLFREVTGEAILKQQPFQYIKNEFAKRCADLNEDLYILQREREFSNKIVSTRIGEMMDWLEYQGYSLIGSNKTGKLGLKPSQFKDVIQFNPVMTSEAFKWSYSIKIRFVLQKLFLIATHF